MAQQIGRMRTQFPGFALMWRKGQAVWCGDLAPSDCSSLYRMAIAYRFKSAPRVNVLAPELVQRDDKPIPHRYSDGSLCLYFPKYREWTSQMFVADTIVPWASEWLEHYELWHATGVWLGGGEHPRSLKHRSSHAYA